VILRTPKNRRVWPTSLRSDDWIG